MITLELENKIIDKQSEQEDLPKYNSHDFGRKISILIACLRDQTYPENKIRMIETTKQLKLYRTPNEIGQFIAWNNQKPSWENYDNGIRDILKPKFK